MGAKMTQQCRHIFFLVFYSTLLCSNCHSSFPIYMFLYNLVILFELAYMNDCDRTIFHFDAHFSYMLVHVYIDRFNR